MIEVEFLKKEGSYNTPGEIREVDESIAEKLVKSGFAKYTKGEPKKQVEKSNAVPGEVKIAKPKQTK